jgi:hypothetical protein
MNTGFPSNTKTDMVKGKNNVPHVLKYHTMKLYKECGGKISGIFRLLHLI